MLLGLLVAFEHWEVTFFALACMVGWGRGFEIVSKCQSGKTMYIQLGCQVLILMWSLKCCHYWLGRLLTA